MLSLFRFLFAIGLLALSISSSANNSNDYEIIERCKALNQEFTSSLAARDFANYKNIAIWGLKNCKTTLNRDDYYSLYANVALSEREEGNFKKAINFAIECIKNKYGIPECHVELAASSFKIKRDAESLKLINQAKNILVSSISIKKELITEKNLFENVLLKAYINKYESMFNYLENLEKNN